MTINLSSSVGPYLILREGHGKNCTVNAENDDISRTDLTRGDPVCAESPMKLITVKQSAS